MLNKTISVVVRFHQGANLSFLKEALFSVGTQSYPRIQLVIVCQNLSASEVQEIAKFVSELPFENDLPVTVASKVHKCDGHVVINLRTKPGKDIRAKLLATGIASGSGRYLAFLDYDDVVYPHHYSTLIHQIGTTKAKLVVGGTVMVHLAMGHTYPYVERTEPFLKRKFSVIDFFVDNFIPIHSFVIDRRGVAQSHLEIDQTLTAYEDYWVLLNLIVHYKYDLSYIREPSCEYRFRDDHSNSTPVYRPDALKEEKWKSSRKKISALKTKLRFNTDLNSLMNLIVEAKRDWNID